MLAAVDGTRIALPAAAVDRLGLSEGSEVDQACLAGMAEAAQKASIEQDMARYLGAAERTASRLRMYLLRRGYLVELVDRAVEKATGSGWVDDARFAALATKSRAGRGRARMVADLVARGVPRATASAAAAAMDEDAELESLLPLIARKYSGLDRETALRRAALFLVRRGFPPGKSWKAARRALAAGGGEEG